MNQKAQASIEYLMTYGWAFLGILVTIGALNYFGVLDIDNLRGEECTFPPGFICDEYVFGEVIDSDPDAVFIITNTHGADLNITSFTVSGDLLSTSPIDCERNETDVEITPTNTYLWDNEEQVQITCPIDSGDYFVRQNYDLSMQMVFRQQGNTYEYNTSGQARITAQ